MPALAHAPSRPDAVDRLVRTPSYEEATARLQFLVDAGSRVGLVTGEAGVGKTTLLETFSQELRRSAALTAVVNCTAASPQELLWSIAVQLQASVDDDGNPFHLWRGLNDRLLEMRFLREQAVVFADDAGRASPEVLMHLYRLAHGESAADARLSLILTTTPDALARIGRPLLDAVDLRIDLPTWTLEESRVLVDAVDDRTRPIRFAASALERLYRLTGGMPRSILRLAEQARLAARADRLDYVDAAVVDGVYEALGVRMQQAG